MQKPDDLSEKLAPVAHLMASEADLSGLKAVGDVVTAPPERLQGDQQGDFCGTAYLVFVFNL